MELNAGNLKWRRPSNEKGNLVQRSRFAGSIERFYRGAKGGEATPSKGLVFSRDRADAATYAAKIGGELSYIDVPKARVAELRPAANKPDARVIISAEMAQGRRVAEPAQIADPLGKQRQWFAPSWGRRNIGRRRALQAPSASITAANQMSNPPARGWSSRDFADAGRYAFKTGGQLSYIDVPKGRMAEVQPSSKAPATWIVVSPALARERQAVPIVQKAERETTSTQPVPTAAAEGRQSASIKRPRAAKPPSAETVKSKAESAPTSKAGGQRPRTASRVRPTRRAKRPTQRAVRRKAVRPLGNPVALGHCATSSARLENNRQARSPVTRCEGWTDRASDLSILAAIVALMEHRASS